MSGVPVARIWRVQWGQWLAELWRPRTALDPPPPFKAATRDGYPEPVPGCVQVAVRVCSTRRGARHDARDMLARYRAGLPVTVQAAAVHVELVA